MWGWKNIKKWGKDRAKGAWNGIKKVGKVAQLGRYCSWVPGGIGTACGAAATLGSLVNGQYAKAAAMAVGTALSYFGGKYAGKLALKYFGNAGRIERGLIQAPRYLYNTATSAFLIAGKSGPRTCRSYAPSPEMGGGRGRGC